MAATPNLVTLQARLRLNQTTQFQKPSLNVEFKRPFIITSTYPSSPKPKFRVSRSSTISPSNMSTQQSNSDPFEPELKDEQGEEEGEEEKFEWYSEWYAIAPICDVDKRVPHGKRVLGIDLVVWWDRSESGWKVFDDSCPHRLAPLSEGRIDQWGRLQCVYHGWCFNGSGHCQLIPQAPPDGPPVHTSKKACVASYPCTVQNDILWFWPNSDPQYQDILTKKQPPYVAEIDDPSYTKSMGIRDIPYGYEVLVENLMDPAHVPYAHYGIMRIPSDKNRPKADREGGRPLEINVQTMDKSGFFAKQERGSNKFIPPCVFYALPKSMMDRANGALSSSNSEKESETKQRRFMLIFFCIPVSPGKSRLIWTFPRNFAVWIDRIVPRWVFHLGQNLILDSDLYLLHVEEHKIMEMGPTNWQKACFVPTKSDALVIAFRKWLKKYSGGQVDWRVKFDGSLPPTPPREQLMDRYWTHVVNCSSCSGAYKGLKVAETMFQIVSLSLIGLVGVTRQRAALTNLQTSALFCAAVICFAASKWLSHFIYKNFHFHDYNHALR